jgi:hypothetical protein
VLSQSHAFAFADGSSVRVLTLCLLITQLTEHVKSSLPYFDARAHNVPTNAEAFVRIPFHARLSSLALQPHAAHAR